MFYCDHTVNRRRRKCFSPLTDNGGLEVDEDGTWHVLAGASLAEERVERVVAATNGLVTRHLAIGLDAVLQAVQLPAGVPDLDSGLSDVYGDAFTLKAIIDTSRKWG